jgi:hypothetical protein
MENFGPLLLDIFSSVFFFEDFRGMIFWGEGQRNVVSSNRFLVFAGRRVTLLLQELSHLLHALLLPLGADATNANLGSI